MSQLVSPQNNVWVTSAEIPCWWHVTSKVWIVLLTGLAVREFCFNQSEVLHIISMEFLHSFLRCHFSYVSSWHVWIWYFWQIRMHFQGMKLHLIVMPMHPNFLNCQLEFLRGKGLYFMSVTRNNGLTWGQRCTHFNPSLHQCSFLRIF